MRKGKGRRSIIGYKKSLMLMLKGILRIRARIYGLELRRSKREMLSSIFYRMHYCDETVLGVHQLQAKLQWK
jgi:hypothetical protein